MFILARNSDLISRHRIHGRHRSHLDDVVHLVAGLQNVNGYPIKIRSIHLFAAFALKNVL